MSEQPTAEVVERWPVRFRNPYGRRGVAAVLAVVICLLAIGVYALVPVASSGGSVAAASGRYAYEIPEGWTHRMRCEDAPLSGSDLFQDGCTRPAGRAGTAGVYLVSVAGQTDAASVLGALRGEVAGYTACSETHHAIEEEPSSVACLQSTSEPKNKGEMRVRMFGSTVVVELCLLTDQPEVEKGCNFVWAPLRLTS